MRNLDASSENGWRTPAKEDEGYVAREVVVRLKVWRY
jgi:hypothetical protein